MPRPRHRAAASQIVFPNLLCDQFITRMELENNYNYLFQNCFKSASRRLASPRSSSDFEGTLRFPLSTFAASRRTAPHRAGRGRIYDIKPFFFHCHRDRLTAVPVASSSLYTRVAFIRIPNLNTATSSNAAADHKFSAARTRREYTRGEPNFFPRLHRVTHGQVERLFDEIINEYQI